MDLADEKRKEDDELARQQKAKESGRWRTEGREKRLDWPWTGPPPPVAQTSPKQPEPRPFTLQQVTLPGPMICSGALMTTPSPAEKQRVVEQDWFKSQFVEFAKTPEFKEIVASVETPQLNNAGSFDAKTLARWTTQARQEEQQDPDEDRYRITMSRAVDAAYHSKSFVVVGTPVSAQLATRFEKRGFKVSPDGLTISWDHLIDRLPSIE
jgi:hypothetical protein